MHTKSILWIAGLVLTGGLLVACESPDYGGDGMNGRTAPDWSNTEPGAPGTEITPTTRPSGEGSGGSGGGMTNPGGY